MRRSSRRAWRIAGAVAAGALCLGAAYVVVHGVAVRREARMQLAADAAQAAIRAARQADAMRWAPDELAAAERASHDALTRHRVEQVGFWFVPDPVPVVDAWSAVERGARTAERLARERRTAGANSAWDEIERARQALAETEQVAAKIYLGDERRLLASAHTALDEARSFERAGELENAASRARVATSLAGQARDRAAALAARYADADRIAQWQRWKNETVAWSKREGRAAIVVVKDAHLMTLFVRGEPVRTYTVELGFNWIADKVQEGDGSTPEGRYHVVSRLDNLASDFYKALLIDYPNAEDRAEFGRARRSGELPSSARIGSLIEIHGGGGRGRDWTNGCVAVTNKEIADLFGKVPIGTPVTIVGSDTYGPIAEFADRFRRNAAGRRP